MDAELLARYPESATLREQQRVPTALRAVLPPGLQGALATAMLGFFISTREYCVMACTLLPLSPADLLRGGSSASEAAGPSTF